MGSDVQTDGVYGVVRRGVHGGWGTGDSYRGAGRDCRAGAFAYERADSYPGADADAGADADGNADTGPGVQQDLRAG